MWPQSGDGLHNRRLQLLQGKQPFDGHGWNRRLSARRKGSNNEVKEEIAISPAIAIPILLEVGYAHIISS